MFIDCRVKCLCVFFVLFCFEATICHDSTHAQVFLSSYLNENDIPQSSDCAEVLSEFAISASRFTLCAIENARPVHMCERCISQYINFTNSYDAALNEKVNSTTSNTTVTCRSLLISNDKLDVLFTFHNNILHVWEEANCHACYNWSTIAPTPSNSTLKFYTLFNITKNCINNNISPSLNNSEQVCEQCMKGYIELDTYYQSLSDESGNDFNKICMDIVDSMNTTRSVWSGLLNCCRLRKHPEYIFLCCAGLIGALPLLFYVILRYCGTMRDLPRILKQTRFKQTFLAALQPRRQSSS